jgi:hypothetical protein
VTDEPGAARRDAIASLVILGALAAIAVGRPVARRLAAHPSPDACRTLLDRHAELVAQAAAPEPPKRPSDPKRAPRAPVSPDDPAVARCARLFTLAEADCAARAGDADAFERCLP